jgi:nitrite reductase/ring-hydroxylating ferredoxin subunit/uncharacterized membrane protein
MATSAAMTAVEQQQWLETVSKQVQPAITHAFASGGLLGRGIKNFLHGTWLGHPLHPVLTDIPIGAWATALVLDGLEVATGRPEFGRSANTAIKVGLIGAVGAALTGVTDWQHTEQRARRLGLMHGLLNTVAAALYTTSVVQRQRQQRSAGRWLALLGFMVANGAAYLGGELVYGERIGVDHAAGNTGPRTFTPVLAAQALAEGQMCQVEVEGTPVMLARHHGHIYALVNTCSHLGGPLCEGTLEEGNVRCPWHGSCFALQDGRVVDGPATYPQPWFETRVQNGQIEIRAVHPKNW